MSFDPVPMMHYSVRCLGNKLCWKIAKIDAASLIAIWRPWNSFH